MHLLLDLVPPSMPPDGARALDPGVRARAVRMFGLYSGDRPSLARAALKAAQVADPPPHNPDRPWSSIRCPTCVSDVQCHTVVRVTCQSCREGETVGARLPGATLVKPAVMPRAAPCVIRLFNVRRPSISRV